MLHLIVSTPQVVFKYSLTHHLSLLRNQDIPLGSHPSVANTQGKGRLNQDWVEV
jgi:hypothetical protein